MYRPPPEAVVMLITRAGDWNPVARSDDRRLIVRARDESLPDEHDEVGPVEAVHDVRAEHVDPRVQPV